MQTGLRIGESGALFQDYVFTDSNGDRLGITATEKKGCECGMLIHITVAAEGVWVPGSIAEMDQLINVLTRIRNGEMP